MLKTTPWWADMQDEDGTYFVNRYHNDYCGITRRDTIAEGLTEIEARRLVVTMTKGGR